MNDLFDSFMKLLVVLVATCVAIRLAYDVVRPAIPAISIVVIAIAVWQLVRWYRDRW
jgi:uncharacterized protein YqgC (DUF456 family)